MSATKIPFLPMRLCLTMIDQLPLQDPDANPSARVMEDLITMSEVAEVDPDNAQEAEVATEVVLVLKVDGTTLTTMVRFSVETVVVQEAATVAAKEEDSEVLQEAALVKVVIDH